MRALKNVKSHSGDEAVFSDAQSYVAKAKAYCARSGREDGNHTVILIGSHEWSEWMDYFSHIGHPHAKPHSFANSIGKMTVPARFPDQFEPGWRASSICEPQQRAYA